MPVSVKKKDGGKIPGPANVPGVIEIAMVFTLPNGKLARNVVHGAYTTVPPNMQTLANALFTSISSAWATRLGALMATGCIFQNVQVRDMSSFTNPIYISTGTAQPGTGPGSPMPADNAIVLTEQIASRGKGLKGRIFLAGWVVAADSGQGQITAAAQTACNSFGSDLLAAISAQSLVPCVAQVARQQYQGITGTVHPARPANHVTVTSYTCHDLEWDTQRRRGH
jgi:hypothetical protein